MHIGTGHSAQCWVPSTVCWVHCTHCTRYFCAPLLIWMYWRYILSHDNAIRANKPKLSTQPLKWNWTTKKHEAIVWMRTKRIHWTAERINEHTSIQWWMKRAGKERYSTENRMERNEWVSECKREIERESGNENTEKKNKIIDKKSN